MSEVKSHKRFLASIANAIKHRQARIRLYSCRYRLRAQTGSLHGFFIEGVNNGVVGPDKLFHANQNVFSITTLIWEVITFVFLCSQSLRTFLQEELSDVEGKSGTQSKQFDSAVAAAARLPLYTFGEEHPFDRVLVPITVSSENTSKIKSALPGTICDPWDVEVAPVFLGDRSEFEGDGISVTFHIVKPSSVGFRRWR
jgi:hypothetical protein